MPAKKVISKEKIIDEALNIVRKEGMEGLNMRTLAKACNCSTQPLYLSFSGMDELKTEVIKRIFSIYVDFIHIEVASGKYPEYMSTGMGYIRFAKDEPEFFRQMFMCNRGGNKTLDELAGFNEEIYGYMRGLGTSEGELAELHTHMWIWVHGIATMYATCYLELNWETVAKMLIDAFFGIKERLDKK